MMVKTVEDAAVERLWRRCGRGGHHCPHGSLSRAPLIMLMQPIRRALFEASKRPVN
jgi:hypothetical protein